MEIPLKATVKFKKLRDGAKAPHYGSEFAAGADLYACLDEPMVFEPFETKLVPTGIATEIPVGFAGLIYARSGLATKQGLAPANKVGVVDSDYRGEIMVALLNHSNSQRMVEPNDRIAQFVITPYLTAVYEETEDLSDTIRGEGGFGSTGKR